MRHEPPQRQVLRGRYRRSSRGATGRGREARVRAVSSSRRRGPGRRRGGCSRRPVGGAREGAIWTWRSSSRQSCLEAATRPRHGPPPRGVLATPYRRSSRRCDWMWKSSSRQSCLEFAMRPSEPQVAASQALKSEVERVRVETEARFEVERARFPRSSVASATGGGATGDGSSGMEARRSLTRGASRADTRGCGGARRLVGGAHEVRLMWQRALHQSCLELALRPSEPSRSRGSQALESEVERVRVETEARFEVERARFTKELGHFRDKATEATGTGYSQGWCGKWQSYARGLSTRHARRGNARRLVVRVHEGPN